MAHQGLSLTFSEQRLCKNETDSGMVEGLYSTGMLVRLCYAAVQESKNQTMRVTDQIFFA